MTAPIIRIVLRYVIGAWFSTSLGAALVNDPDVMTLVDAVIAPLIATALTEFWYWLARKVGWAT